MTASRGVPEPFNDCVVRLYITGRGALSQRAIAATEAACARCFLDGYSLEVIDLLESPARAENDRILVTPAMVRDQPPQAAIVGDFQDVDQLSAALVAPVGIPPPVVRPTLAQDV